MTVLRAVGLAFTLMCAALLLGGCPALLIPGLAYQGYKATHESKTETSADGATDKSRHSSTSETQSSRSAADRSIE
jgi:hypothetical protein